MPTAYKVLGQANPAAATLTTLYTVPAATSSVISTLAICNLGVVVNVRVAIRPAGAAISNQHYILYDASLATGDSVFLTIGITLAATDVVSVYAGTANVAFTLNGSEIT